VELVVSAMILVAGLTGVLVALGRILEGAMLVTTQVQATSVAQTVLGEQALNALAGGEPLAGEGKVGLFRWTLLAVPDAGEPPRPLETWLCEVTWPVRRMARRVSLATVWARLS